MIDFITALWFGFLGACLGSFLNVVAYRMPRELSVVWQPSHCPHCGKPIRPYDNVPILGWLWLRGRCRDCQAPIAPRYAIVETVLGAAFFALAYVEIFSGGGNLPGGPVTDETGAWHTVWNPYWPLLSTYLVHGGLLALLTAVVLFDLDRTPAPRRFCIVAAVLLLVATVAAPAAWQGAARSVDAVPAWPTALAAAATAAVPGALLAWAASRRATQKKPGATLHVVNAGVALALAGSVLGARAVPVVAGGAALIAVALSVRNRESRRVASWLTLGVAVASATVIMFWGRVNEISP